MSNVISYCNLGLNLIIPYNYSTTALWKSVYAEMYIFTYEILHIVNMAYTNKNLAIIPMLYIMLT